MGALELELQTIVHPTWVLGIKLWTRRLHFVWSPRICPSRETSWSLPKTLLWAFGLLFIYCREDLAAHSGLQTLVPFPLTLEVQLAFNTLTPVPRMRETTLIQFLSLNHVNATNWSLLGLAPLLPI